jgi:uncharacterized protein (UPF0548 family)
VKPADLSVLALSYEPVGLTRHGPPPAGFDHLGVVRRLGTGDAAYRAAAEAVMTFGAQRGTGLRPQATAPRAAEGVELVSHLGPVDIPCRVVWAVEGPDRTGFGYGTLAGHPEAGEEAFIVERRGDDVVGVIRAYSRPATTLARLGGPLTRLTQRVTALAYLAALRRAARQHGGCAAKGQV